MTKLICALILFFIASKKHATRSLLATLLFISGPSHALDLNPESRLP